MLKAYKAGAPESVWPPLKRIAGVLRGLAALVRPFKDSLGRDAKQALFAIDALKEAIG